MKSLRERARDMTERQIDNFFDDIEDTCIQKDTAFVLCIFSAIVGGALGWLLAYSPC